MEKILFIGAHPDDIEISSSGLITKLIKNNKQVDFIICSSGSIRGDSNTRINEQDLSNKFLNVNSCKILDWIDGNIQNNSKHISELEKTIKIIKPDVIFTHYYKDTHQDHENVSKMVKSICYRKNINLIYFDSNSSFEFTPNLYASIDFENKLKNLNLFESQLKNSNYIEKVKIKNKYYGINSDSDYSEGYITNKVVLL